MDGSNMNENLIFKKDMDHARFSKIIKRLIWAIVIITVTCIIGFIINNIVWVKHYEKLISEYEYVSYDYEQDGGGVNIIGDRNGVVYDVTETTDQVYEEEEP